MYRAKKIISEIIEEINPSDFNQMVYDFHANNYVRVVEKQVIYHDTFFKLFKIFASNYHESIDIYIKNTNSVEYLSKDESTNQAKVFAAINYGPIDILSRVNVFLYLLNTHCGSDLNPFKELNDIMNKDLLTTKRSLRMHLKYLMKKSNTKSEIFIPSFKLFMLSVISGKTINVIKEQIVDKYNNGELKL